MINSGVYRITSRINGLVYIGSSIELKKRISRHKRELKQGLHNNGHLQNHYNKYGDVFDYNIELYIVGTIPEIRDYENYYIEFYKAYNKDFGFNIMKDSVSWEGFRHSEDTKKKCLEAGIKASLLTRKRMLGVCPETGEIVENFDSISKARSKYPGVQNILAGKAYYAGGLIWVKELDYDRLDVKAYNTYVKNKRFKCDHANNVLVLDVETGVYYDTLKDAAESIDTPYANFTIRMKANKYKNKFAKV
jgi:group I intron endonuclease